MASADTTTAREHYKMRRRLIHDLAYEVSVGTYSVEVVRGAVLDQARHCDEPLVVFCRLVDAVKELSRFCRSEADEVCVLAEHNIPVTDESRETYLSVLQERVDTHLDALMAPVAERSVA